MIPFNSFNSFKEKKFPSKSVKIDGFMENGLPPLPKRKLGPPNTSPQEI